MCLNNISEELIAKKDIICYKHFDIRTIRGEERYVSTYRGKLWPKKGLTSVLGSNSYTIEQGLHAFKYKKHAIEDKNAENAKIVLKMIIPKGSKYYTGTFFGYDSITANKMKFYETGN